MTEVSMLMLGLVYIGLAVVLLSIVLRAVRAHERLADAVEKLAQRQEKEVL
jgi:hypothetical protein